MGAKVRYEFRQMRAIGEDRPIILPFLIEGEAMTEMYMDPHLYGDEGSHSADPAEDKGQILKDSGKREEFSTGSRRDSREGKGRFDLLFMGMPEALRRLAVLLERGAAKYGERNWERGQPISRYIDSAARHLHRAAQGMTDEDHLIQLAWNAMAAVETLHRIKNGTLGAQPDEADRLNDVYLSHDVEPK